MGSRNQFSLRGPTRPSLCGPSLCGPPYMEPVTWTLLRAIDFSYSNVDPTWAPRAWPLLMWTPIRGAPYVDSPTCTLPRWTLHTAYGPSLREASFPWAFTMRFRIWTWTLPRWTPFLDVPVHGPSMRGPSIRGAPYVDSLTCTLPSSLRGPSLYRPTTLRGPSLHPPS